MNPRRIFAVFIRQIFLIISNPTRLTGMFIWLIIAIVQWGFITKYLGILGKATFSFITVILGAVILWEFMSRIQQGTMTAFLEDIWSQNFINYFASPLKVSEYIAGLILTSVVSTILSFIVMNLIAGLAFGYNIFKLGLLLLPFITILFFFGMAMGIFVSGMIFRLGPAAEWMGWPIPLVLSIFCGVFYPLKTLPQVMRIVSYMLPPAYIFESMRSLLNSQTLDNRLLIHLLIAGVMALLYLLLAYLFFNQVYRRNLKTGSIARFTAEEV